MKQTIFKFSYCLIFTFVFSSCQKVIEVNLNAAAPQLVVEGSVTDQSGPYSVKLSQTVNFSDANVFPAASGAQIIISDNAGNSETLTEISSGYYNSSALQGVAGRTYNMSITFKGKNYTASSTMPAPVKIDSITVDTSSNGGFGGGFGKKKSVTINVQFKDTAGIANYYRLVETVNGIQKNDVSIVSDNLQDGSVINRSLSRRDTTIHAGDVVQVQLQSIDKNVYEYFRTLNLLAGGAGAQSASPANPTSNINNSALGYFSAYSVTSKSIVVP